MTRNIKFSIILSLLILSATYSFAQQPEILPVKLNLISTGMYEVLEGRGARGGVFVGENGVLVIDSKMDKKSVDETLEEIRKLTDKPIRYLINTHSDADHINGNQYFPQATIFIAHENCRKEFFHPLRDGTPSPWIKPELAPFLPSITYQNQMNLYLGPKRVELWYFGVGHTTGDTVVYFREQKTAFIGDQLFLERPHLIHAYKGGNSFEHVKTLTRMLETLDAEKFYSGHSEKADRKTIMKHIAEMKERQEKVKTLIDKNRTLEEIKGEFKQTEAALIETIYSEIKRSK